MSVDLLPGIINAAMVNVQRDRGLDPGDRGVEVRVDRADRDVHVRAHVAGDELRQGQPQTAALTAATGAPPAPPVLVMTIPKVVPCSWQADAERG